MIISPPRVWVHIPTYARTSLLREALESVRRQTYKGPVTVYVGNDCPWQHLSVDFSDWPDNFTVWVDNQLKRAKSLGAKRQLMLDQTPDDVWIAFLDDDDLWMPWYLEQSLGVDSPSYDVINSAVAFTHRHTLWTYDELAGGIPMLVRSELANQAKFPLDCSYGEDNQFRQKLFALPGISIKQNKRPGYTIRAGGGHVHASLANEARFMLSAEVQREKGLEPQGFLTVKAAWDQPYDEILREKFPEVF